MIDTHCHLLKEYYNDIENVINKMENNIIIVSGTNKIDIIEVIELCNKYKNVYGTIGFHPSEISNLTLENLDIIENNISNPKIVAIGEIGLDYYWNKDNKDNQNIFFIKQLEIAKKHKKAVVIHTRDSIMETYDILNTYGKDLKKIIHCYSGSYEMALKFININSILGIGGVVTFKNSKLREVVKMIDLKNIILETDSPFLTPEPFRGKRNEPYNITFIAQEISNLKDIPIEIVYKTTTENATRQFDLPF